MSQKRGSSRGDGAQGETSAAGKHGKQHRYRTPVSVLVVFVAAAAGAWIDSIVRPQTSHALSERVPPAPAEPAPPARPQPAQRALESDHDFYGARGPWGQLNYRRIAISIPDDYAPAEPSVDPIQWWFKGRSHAGVEKLFKDANLTPAQLQSLGQAEWKTSEQGVIVSPTRQLVMELSPESRAHIYEVLAACSLNTAQQSPEVFRAEYLDERIDSSGLDAATVALFRKMLYPRHDRLLFSDTEVVLGTLSNGHDRKRFHEMVHRKATYTAQLVIDKTSDIDAMVAYWTYPGRPKGLRTLFESLARVPGGATLDIAHLLPPFARQHLYTYPDPAPVNSIAEKRDCLWTSFNFFGDEPDDRYIDPAFTSAVIARDYHQVPAPRFGDLAVLTDTNQQSVHFAVYLADNMVFTKNGANQMQPWMLMTLPDVVTFYSITLPHPLAVRYLRHR